MAQDHAEHIIHINQSTKTSLKVEITAYSKLIPFTADEKYVLYGVKKQRVERLKIKRIQTCANGV